MFCPRTSVLYVDSETRMWVWSGKTSLGQWRSSRRGQTRGIDLTAKRGQAGPSCSRTADPEGHIHQRVRLTWRAARRALRTSRIQTAGGQRHHRGDLSTGQRGAEDGDRSPQVLARPASARPMEGQAFVIQARSTPRLHWDRACDGTRFRRHGTLGDCPMPAGTCIPWMRRADGFHPNPTPQWPRRSRPGRQGRVGGLEAARAGALCTMTNGEFNAIRGFRFRARRERRDTQPEFGRWFTTGFGLPDSRALWQDGTLYITDAVNRLPAFTRAGSAASRRHF